MQPSNGSAELETISRLAYPADSPHTGVRRGFLFLSRMKKNNHSNPTAVNTQKAVDFHLKKGALHSELGIKQGAKIATSKLEHEKAVAKKTGNTTLEKRVNFAINARSFKH